MQPCSIRALWKSGIIKVWRCRGQRLGSGWLMMATCDGAFVGRMIRALGRWRFSTSDAEKSARASSVSASKRTCCCEFKVDSGFVALLQGGSARAMEAIYYAVANLAQLAAFKGGYNHSALLRPWTCSN